MQPGGGVVERVVRRMNDVSPEDADWSSVSDVESENRMVSWMSWVYLEGLTCRGIRVSRFEN